MKKVDVTLVYSRVKKSRHMPGLRVNQNGKHWLDFHKSQKVMTCLNERQNGRHMSGLN